MLWFLLQKPKSFLFFVLQLKPYLPNLFEIFINPSDFMRLFFQFNAHIIRPSGYVEGIACCVKNNQIFSALKLAINL